MKPPPATGGPLGDNKEILDRWGLLPKKMAEQMQNSKGKDYPPEYREAISRYYRKLSQLSEGEAER